MKPWIDPHPLRQPIIELDQRCRLCLSGYTRTPRFCRSLSNTADPTAGSLRERGNPHFDPLRALHSGADERRCGSLVVVDRRKWYDSHTAVFAYRYVGHAIVLNVKQIHMCLYVHLWAV